VWGSQQPSWITSVDSATQRTEVENWIKAVCARYPKIDQIDVVNEPLHAAPSYKNALGGNGKTGWDWVVTSFQLARKYANPTTKLLINDYSILQSNSETDSYIAIIDTLKSRGLIDGIGIQGHYFEFRSETGTTPSYAYSISTLQSNLNRITALGLPLYISEFDINESVDSLQLQYYKTYFPMFWENPVVKGMTLWGYVEYDMWKADAFLIDDRYVERPAMKWLRNYLQTPFKPVLVSPVSAVNVIRNPVLIWNASAAADSYHVQLSTNSTFATVIVDTTVTDTTLNLGLLDANARYYWRASSINSYGESDFSAGVAFLTGTALGVNDRKPIALDFKLSQNYPNPFNPTTMISFTLPQRSNIHLTLVDMLGREVKEIASGEFEAGIHTVQLNASGLASGVYIYRLNAGNYGSAKKLIVTK
jgi:endo-1,4-beta-xylanase